MNRRGFLSLLGKATVGGVVAYSFPSIIVPKNIQPASYLMGPYGLAYLLNDNSRVLQGLSTVTFPDLNAPPIDLRGAMISPQMFEYARARLNEMTYRIHQARDFGSMG